MTPIARATNVRRRGKGRSRNKEAHTSPHSPHGSGRTKQTAVVSTHSRAWAAAKNNAIKIVRRAGKRLGNGVLLHVLCSPLGRVFGSYCVRVVALPNRSEPTSHLSGRFLQILTAVDMKNAETHAALRIFGSGWFWFSIPNLSMHCCLHFMVHNCVE